MAGMAFDRKGVAERLETLSEHGYVQLKGDILSGELLPGSKLKIEQLRERYGVGATPLREALSRLSSEGLVQIEQLKGFRVATVSWTELEELCALRVMVEGEALRRSTVHGDEHWEGEIVAAYHALNQLEAGLRQGGTLDPDDWEERNRAFHDALAAAASSTWLMRVRALLFDHHERYRRYSRTILRVTPLRDVTAEHRAMKNAALERDGERLAGLMQTHIMSILDLLRGSIGP